MPETGDRARALNVLNSTGRTKLDIWATRVPGHNVVYAPDVSELPGGLIPNSMIATRTPSGAVDIRPPIFAAHSCAPIMVLRRSTQNPAGVEFELNGKLLTAQSPMEDLRLAINLVELL